MANKYYNFMEVSVGIGKTGTHIAHAGVAGAATYGLGHFGGVQAIQGNPWAPIIGAAAGLGMSLAVRYMLVSGSDERSVDILLAKMEKDLKGRTMTAEQRARAAQLIGYVQQQAPQAAPAAQPISPPQAGPQQAPQAATP